MSQIKNKNRTQYLWKLIMAGGFLTLLSIVFPSAMFMISGVWVFLWYIGFWWGQDVYGGENMGFASDFFESPYDDTYMTIGVITMVLLIIALILMLISARNTKHERSYKLNAGMSLLGGILAIIGPIAYYFFLDAEIPVLFWDLFFPFIGIFLSIIAGIVGILGAIMVGYASTLGSKMEER